MGFAQCILGNIVARRKKKVIKEIDRGPAELGEWKLDEEVWFPKTDIATPHKGIVKRFFPDDKICQCACIWDETGGGYRTVPLSFMFRTKKEAKDSRPKLLEFWENYRIENEKK